MGPLISGPTLIVSVRQSDQQAQQTSELVQCFHFGRPAFWP
ncbi:hypothetical protein SPW_5942 [Streptomyces sp. W007]|nr:hypothetical protein SPW_5942 [Streptomyces sp. W007]